MELFINDQPISSAPPVQEWQPVEFACAPAADTTLELLVGHTALEPFLRPGDALWRWRWNPQNSVGVFQLTLRATQGTSAFATSITYPLRVAPRKLAQDQYALLLEHLQRDASSLVAALVGGAEGAALARQITPPLSALEQFAAFFGERLNLVERAALHAAQRPHSALVSCATSAPLDAATILDGATLADVVTQPLDPAPPDVAPALQELLRPDSGLLPRALTQWETTTSYDTPENRLVRDLVDGLLRRARQIGKLARLEQQRLERNEPLVGSTPAYTNVCAIANTCVAAERRLRRLRALPFLAGTTPGRPLARPSSRIVQRDPAYRQLYNAWRDLRASALIALDSSLFHLPINDLPTLYEVWCAVRMALALLALPGWSHTASYADSIALPTNEAGFVFRLQEDLPILTLTRGECSLTLRYQPRYRPRRKTTSADLVSLDRHTRVPDLAIELRRQNAPPTLFICDAKYRLDATGGVPEDALADAYTYRGSIGRLDGTGAVASAMLLYPGTGAAERYTSGVGALPLLPNNENNVHQWLQEALALHTA